MITKHGSRLYAQLLRHADGLVVELALSLDIVPCLSCLGHDRGLFFRDSVFHASFIRSLPTLRVHDLGQVKRGSPGVLGDRRLPWNRCPAGVGFIGGRVERVPESTANCLWSNDWLGCMRRISRHGHARARDDGVQVVDDEWKKSLPGAKILLPTNTNKHVGRHPRAAVLYCLPGKVDNAEVTFW
jgi:hypothetical protein